MQPLPIIITMGCKHGGVEKENNPFGVAPPEETTTSHQHFLDTIFDNGSTGQHQENDEGRMDRVFHQGHLQGSYRDEDGMSSSTPRRNNHAVGLRRQQSNDHPGAPSRSRKAFPRTVEPWGDLASTSSIPPPPGFASSNETQRLSDEIIDTAMKLMDLTIQQDRYIRNLEKEFTEN